MHCRVVSEVGGIEKTAQLTIVADDTHPLVVVEHLLDDWKLDLPNICISVIGMKIHHTQRTGGLPFFLKSPPPLDTMTTVISERPNYNKSYKKSVVSIDTILVSMKTKSFKNLQPVAPNIQFSC